MPAKRAKTLEQLAAMKDKAVRFVRDVLDDPERADEIEDEDLFAYADRKGIAVLQENPNSRRTTMAGRMTRQELENRIDELEAENESLSEKLDSIADLASGDEDDDDGED